MRQWLFSCLALSTAALLSACAEPEVLARPLTTPSMAHHDHTPQSGHLISAPARTNPAASPTVEAEASDWDGVLATSGRLPSWTRWHAGAATFDGGASITRMDDLYVHSDGRWSRRVGESFQHSDGGTTVRRGDTFFHSDGSWSRRVGDTVTTSEGRACSIRDALMVCP